LTAQPFSLAKFSRVGALNSEKENKKMKKAILQQFSCTFLASASRYQRGWVDKKT